PTFTHGAEALEAREALAGHIARYTVAVIPETRPDLGTGVLVSSGDALFVATARYVAKDLRLDKVYCIPRPKWIKIIPREEIRRRRSEMEPSERFRLDVEERILSSREDDVALRRRRRRPEERRDMESYPLERGQSSALP